MTERTCDYSKCDETFPRGGRRRYCCRLHKEKARKEDRGPHRPCAWCGTSFVTTGSRRYCSSGCSWAGARHIINAEKNAGSLDLRCRWIPPEPVERYRGAYYHALKADPCAYCGEPAGSIDHIDPSSRGGTNEHDNLTGACTSCNSSKHSTPLLRHMLLRLIARDLDPLLAEYAAAGDLENIPNPMKKRRLSVRARCARSALHWKTIADLAAKQGTGQVVSLDVLYDTEATDDERDSFVEAIAELG